MIDRLSKPGLVALYDTRPGNVAGLFLQPRSPHGALSTKTTVSITCAKGNLQSHTYKRYE